MAATIEADYLVVGAGAMGLAFADTLVSESDATVVVVDRNDRPGGHWTTAYPFVRLHQPSAYYGVNSLHLGSDSIDESGLNAGFYELASGAEVCGYFDEVMREHLLPTGRVTYLPGSEYLGDGRVRGADGDPIEVIARRVVTSHTEIVVPSMRPPAYAVAAGVDVVAPNDVPGFAEPRDRYVVVGAGKTAMDSCLWLLRNGVAPERVTWVKPRESWVLDRGAVQPGRQFAQAVMRDFGNQLTAVQEAESLRDLFDRLEAGGCLHRIDTSVEPTMYRCAILSAAELAELRRITDVVRMGRVASVEPGRMTLDGGVRDVEGSVLYIDCSADGLGSEPPVPVFDGDRIALQTVRTCQPAFSAAVIAHVEAAYPDDETRNSFCEPVPYPHEPVDWLRMTLAFNRNQMRWFSDPDMLAWVDAARLNALHHVTANVSARARERIVSMLTSQLPAMNAKLETLLADG
ncbi:Pyridine nucleotide-disulphide oxidoreductase [Mycolicibacterium rutilum]|uniref:Pyridine nucleotide-disulphide oxidoreductase n=1 Tax=Mycolicibacterium rutilum TaxID=370526 RepID=A0A1H6JTQ0_MYCRU|nr:NAD(P)-binding protein [Mycolicibacterium rutilum]SEH64356.1 Pyridine nucleotide-disulphide oxidoreductase [Mycolicibacterium rutilum]